MGPDRMQTFTREGLGAALGGTHPESARVWRDLTKAFGEPPGHNLFVQLAVRVGVSRTQARRDYQTLANHDNGDSIAAATDRPTPPQPQKEQPVSQPTTRETPVPVVAEVEEVPALRAQVQQLRAQVEAHAPVVEAVQGVLALLAKDDDAFDSFARLVRPVSTHSQRTLQRYLWGLINRPLHPNDFIALP